jgi:hypothetical protein
MIESLAPAAETPAPWRCRTDSSARMARWGANRAKAVREHCLLQSVWQRESMMHSPVHIISNDIHPSRPLPILLLEVSYNSSNRFLDIQTIEIQHLAPTPLLHPYAAEKRVAMCKHGL